MYPVGRFREPTTLTELQILRSASPGLSRCLNAQITEKENGFPGLQISGKSDGKRVATYLPPNIRTIFSFKKEVQNASYSLQKNVRTQIRTSA
ncbi:hypothetical protein PM082_024059 [Marasmius tenuissimus]|nr:hypothetical protein PM082_024059 [Marasmius tenuissimus]